MNPVDTLRGAVKTRKTGDMESVICCLVEKVFTTRNLLHFAHWSTKSYASHMALGDLYDQIISDVDEIVEVFQGKFGLIDGLCCAKACLPKDITAHVKDEAKWVEDNRTFISRGDSAIENLIDNLVAHYHKAVYKLENLK